MASAAVLTKASSGTVLTSAASWVDSLGNAVAAAPTGADTGLFNSTANASSQASPFTIPSGNPTWGALQVTNPSAPVFISVGTGTWTLAGNTSANTFIDMSGATQDLTITGTTADRIMRLSSTNLGPYAINVANNRTFTLGSNMVLGSQGGTRTLNLTGGGSFVFDGNIIQNGNVNFGVTLNSSGGVATFNEANTYNQATTITAGTLYLNGTHVANAAVATTTGPGNYTVDSGAVLAGTGSVTFGTATSLVSRTVTVNGTIAPGSVTTPIESLEFLQVTGSTADVALAGNANFDIDLGTDQFDKLILGNALTYGGVLNVTLTGSDPGQAVYDLFDFASFSGEFATINVTGLGEGQSADFNYQTGQLSIVVPEPTTLTLLGLGALAAIARRRRAGARPRQR